MRTEIWTMMIGGGSKIDLCIERGSQVKHKVETLHVSSRKPVEIINCKFLKTNFFKN
jgi:hypothetical protein